MGKPTTGIGNMPNIRAQLIDSYVCEKYNNIFSYNLFWLETLIKKIWSLFDVFYQVPPCNIFCTQSVAHEAI